ncbi:hypothetical protein VTN31DRAFT_7082 [Thermomyces dupontii]|uniref:uncharacterized protein n=1 Tax=Talaromyces thermophilus TaxID=28565 RepID=UPI00374466B7
MNTHHHNSSGGHHPAQHPTASSSTGAGTKRPLSPIKAPPPNPPSVEAAYKRKCIQMKKRLNEIETENANLRRRNERGWQYVRKMRLETCILLEHLAKVTGMVEELEAGGNTKAGEGLAEVRARARAVLGESMEEEAEEEEELHHNNKEKENGVSGAARRGEQRSLGNGLNASELGVLDDETEGSSEEMPPTPQERPLRSKRSRKSNLPGDDHEGAGSGAGGDGGDGGDHQPTGTKDSATAVENNEPSSSRAQESTSDNQGQ